MLNEKKLSTIGILFIIYNFCANLSNDIYLPSLPHLADVLQTTPNLVQLTLTAWFLGNALPQLFLGPLSDYLGRRPILYGGTICFLIASIVCAFATNIYVLLIARFFQGVGVCSWNVASFAILADLYQHTPRTKLINRMNMFGILAPLIGPIIGGYMLVYAGWQSNFIIVFLMGLGCLIGFIKYVPESNPYFNSEALYIKNICKNYLLLIKENGFIRHLIPYCLLLSCLVAYLTAAPFIIIDQLKIDPRHFGYTQFSIFGAYILGAVMLDRQKNEMTIRKFLNLGLLLTLFATFVLLILSFAFKENLLIFILPMSLFTLGFGFCSSPLISEVMATQISTKGSASAFLGFSMAISCVISSFFVGLIYNGSIFSIALLLFVLNFIGAFVYLSFKEKAEPSIVTT